MPRHHVNNFPPGTYVEHVDREWVGTVKRITVNPFGEPILVVDVAFLKERKWNGTFKIDPVEEDTIKIHPMHVQRLDEDTVVSTDQDEDN
jgi:hypothetical protein